MRQGTSEEYPRPAFCGFHMQAHKTAAEQEACDADYERYAELRDEAEENAFAAMAANQGKTVDEMRTFFRELAESIWEGASPGCLNTERGAG